MQGFESTRRIERDIPGVTEELLSGQKDVLHADGDVTRGIWGILFTVWDLRDETRDLLRQIPNVLRGVWDILNEIRDFLRGIQEILRGTQDVRRAIWDVLRRAQDDRRGVREELFVLKNRYNACICKELHRFYVKM